MEELELPVQACDTLGSVLRREGEKTIWLVFVSAKLKDTTDLVLHDHGKAAWILPEEAPQYEFCPADQSFLNSYLPTLAK
jgi:hypothetical protein